MGYKRKKKVLTQTQLHLNSHTHTHTSFASLEAFQTQSRCSIIVFYFALIQFFPVFMYNSSLFFFYKNHMSSERKIPKNASIAVIVIFISLHCYLFCYVLCWRIIVVKGIEIPWFTMTIDRFLKCNTMHTICFTIPISSVLIFLQIDSVSALCVRKLIYCLFIAIEFTSELFFFLKYQCIY